MDVPPEARATPNPDLHLRLLLSGAQAISELRGGVTVTAPPSASGEQGEAAAYKVLFSSADRQAYHL